MLRHATHSHTHGLTTLRTQDNEMTHAIVTVTTQRREQWTCQSYTYNNSAHTHTCRRSNATTTTRETAREDMSTTLTHSLSLRRNVIKGDNKGVKTLHRNQHNAASPQDDPPHMEQQASSTSS